MEGNVFMEQWNEYLEALASKAPTPGGGSAAAVYGAIGTALGEMVGNLTSGKKKFAIYEEDVQKILARLGGARMATPASLTASRLPWSARNSI